MAEKSLITIEEFASLMKISRSTAYSWLASGRLETGRHVLHIGSVVRILWGDELLQHLMQQSKTPEPRPKLIRKGKGGLNKCSLNFDYLDV